MDADRYRQIMGRFATGVTVVTTEVEGRLHGITVNALASVSLEPLLLLICIDKGAQAHEEIDSCRSFAVNFLTVDQEELSRLFARRGEPEPGRLRGVSYHTGSHGAPVLDGCLAHLECAVHDRWPAGDHTIFLARVLAGDLGEDAPPLLFHRGRYGRMEG